MAAIPPTPSTSSPRLCPALASPARSPAPGWDTRRVARAWSELMHRLGYDRYGTQGGDTGSVVSPELGRIDPEHVIGVHVNNLGTFPSGDPAELTGLTSADRERLALLEKWGRDMSGYAIVQSTRPQTISTPSPIHRWPARLDRREVQGMDRPARQPARRRCRPRPDPHRRERVLADRHSAGSAARIYYEGARTWGQSQQRSPVPTAVAVFPGDTTIRPLAERDHNVVHWAEFSRGGHFAAMEAPDLLVSDVREFFRQFR